MLFGCWTMQVALAHKLGGGWFFGVGAAPVQPTLPGVQGHILHTVTLQRAASLGG